MPEHSQPDILIPDWDNIDTVLLDMDGTLLDLHFDTHFWLEHIPVRYAEANQLSLDESRRQLMTQYKKAEGTLDWYCMDYWADQLQLDIELLKHEVQHLIDVRPDVIPFLQALAANGKHRVLVTNAHSKSVSLKMKKTPIGQHLDKIITAHDIGLPKENPDFWDKLQLKQSFSADSTLLIDDSFNVLASAEQYGIKHLRAILQPNSQQQPDPQDHFVHIDAFADILPGTVK